VTLWRKRADAWATMSAAAPRTNIRADILEKDYWNSQVLRTASTLHPTDFVFKGGTSLSKAYKCTQRFSEEIDVLILRRELGSGARDKLMKKIADGAVEELELTVDPSKHTHGRESISPRPFAIRARLPEPRYFRPTCSWRWAFAEVTSRLT
jgi:predicted nucleotidyltransferase component of viral defense system